MSTNATCPVWGTPATETPSTRTGRQIESSRAGGSYFITDSAVASFGARDDAFKVKLTSWLVEQRRLGVASPEVFGTTLDDVKNRRAPSVHDRADSLLRYLATSSELLGTVVKFFAEDNSKNPEPANMLLAWTSSQRISEVITLAEYSASEGWIEHRVTARAGSSQNTIHEIMLRPPGYSRLALLDGVNTSSSQTFVAMWFDASMRDAYDNGIAPAIRDAGFEPLRIDGKQHNNKIDDEIIAEIRRSRFVVADFTQGAAGARGGVYYEAGFAHGHNIPVIFTCAAASLGDVHFDTRQFNHIVWTDAADLRKQLAHRISATIGDGPLRRRP